MLHEVENTDGSKRVMAWEMSIVQGCESVRVIGPQDSFQTACNQDGEKPWKGYHNLCGEGLLFRLES